MKGTDKTHPSPPHSIKSAGVFALIVIILLYAYLPTLLTRPAGSDDPFMEDSGEIQVTLNVWGTLHGTGYPLYTMLGNSFVSVVRTLGVDPATAPGIFSLVCGLIALAIFYALLLRLTGQSMLAAVSTLLLGLTRATWAYSVLPKTYSFGMLFFVGLLALALWPRIPARRRLWLIALVAGFGVAHHRLIAFAVPGVLLAIIFQARKPATLPQQETDQQPLTLATFVLAVPLGLIGFLPYVYLPARALTHAAWVYGDPSTLSGFWREFTAQEANYLFALPGTFSAWLNDVGNTIGIFFEQLTPIGALLVIPLAVYGATRRLEARIAIWCALPIVGFVLIWPHAVVTQAVVQPIALYLIFAAAIGVNELLALAEHYNRRIPAWLVALCGALGAMALIAWSFGYLRSLVNADAGTQEITLAQRVPRDNGQAVFMLPWGMRYSAVAFSHFVSGQNADLAITDHKADFAALVSDGHTLYTDRDTFYLFPVTWWAARLGGAHLSSPADGVVRIDPQPITITAESPSDPPVPVAGGIVRLNAALACFPDRIDLHVTWGAQSQPTQKFSVFVHLIGADPSQVLATGDESAPVYGWYPTANWQAGEAVEDIYSLDRLPGAEAVQFGLYSQPTVGQFVNYGVTTLSLSDAAGCQSP